MNGSLSMWRRVVVAAAFVLSAGVVEAHAAIQLAFDSAADGAYDDGWHSGDNGGFGFDHWILFDTGNPLTGGLFVGDSANNGSAPSGNINTAGRAWGIYNDNVSDPAATNAGAQRPFLSPLAPGQAFSISMDNGLIDPGGLVFFALGGEHLIKFGFVGGEANYSVFLQDDTGVQDSLFPFTDGGLTVQVTRTTATGFDLAINGIPVFSGVLNDEIRLINLVNSYAGPGATHDLFFNSMSITAPDPDGGAVPEPGTIIVWSVLVSVGGVLCRRAAK